ncbi:hypothetical protein ASG41_20500 [Modestobacter sp. Leaf380]|nr:hypothetical protein ASG41_20500 [Modestobacter sp. Leaf380]
MAAAVDAALSVGVTGADPAVLYEAFSVVVHLAPEPVVARVPTVLPRTVRADLPARLRQMRAELAVTAWLAGRGFPVVVPAHPEPLVADGQALTLWRWVEQTDREVPETESGALVARLHAALADCPVELDWLVPLDESVPDALGQLVADRPAWLTAEDVVRAQGEWDLLAPLATEPAAWAAAFPDAPAQPVHGDAPFYNVIATPSALLSSDFEHVGHGPPEWDLASVPAGVRAGYDAEAARLGLRPLDERALQVAERGRALQLLAVLPLAGELPGMADALEGFAAGWRASSPLADLLRR